MAIAAACMEYMEHVHTVAKPRGDGLVCRERESGFCHID